LTVADVLAVMDAAESATAVLSGSADGGQVAILCAAMHPHRVEKLILNVAWARFFRSEDYQWIVIDAMSGTFDADRVERAVRFRKT
jgi:pimeloyl-ACP methyl ester carboxylesterase